MESPGPGSGPAEQPASTAVLATVGVGKTFGGFHALRDVSVDIGAGEIIGLDFDSFAPRLSFHFAFRPAEFVIPFGFDVT